MADRLNPRLAPESAGFTGDRISFGALAPKTMNFFLYKQAFYVTLYIPLFL
jgi:hypothetical protein